MLFAAAKLHQKLTEFQKVAVICSFGHLKGNSFKFPIHQPLVMCEFKLQEKCFPVPIFTGIQFKVGMA